MGFESQGIELRRPGARLLHPDEEAGFALFTAQSGGEHQIEPRVFKLQPQPQPDEKHDNIDGPWDAFTHAFHGSRMFGVGFCGRLCDNDIDPDKKFKYDDLLKSIKQHRPYFTYWVTFVQTVVCLVSIFAYGLAPVGFSYELATGIATTINLEKQFISYPVKQNFWIGLLRVL